MIRSLFGADLGMNHEDVQIKTGYVACRSHYLAAKIDAINFLGMYQCMRKSSIKLTQFPVAQ